MQRAVSAEQTAKRGEPQGISERTGSVPPFLRMRKILLPVTCETWAMPLESRKMTPICEGARPFLASLQTCSTTSEGEVLSHEGGVRRYGRADFEIPLLQARGGGRAAKTRQR